MATRKKKRTRTSVLKELTMDELLEIIKENDKTNEEIRKIMAKTKPTMDEIRKAIEEAISDLEEVGEFHMMFEGEEYVIRLSQNVKGQIRYDPDSRQIIIVLPDNSLWRRGPNGRWDKRSMDMCIDRIVQIYEARQQIHWCEGEMERLHRLCTLSDDARHVETARQLAVASRQLYEYENKLEYLERMCMTAAAESNRIMEEYGDQLARAKKAKRRAENKKNRAQKQKAQATKEKEKAQASLETVKKDAEKTVAELTGELKIR